MNYRMKAGAFVWTTTLGSLGAIAFMTAGPSLAVDAQSLADTKVSFPEVHRIIQARCVNCHAQYPSNTAFMSPPAGMILEDPAQIAQLSPRILERVWVNKTMPLGNQTNMTEDERKKVAAWIVQGAQITAAPRFEGEPEPAMLEKAKTFYAERCVTCHGKDGHGDGPAAAGMLPRPTNLSDRLWHAQVSDEELRKVILEGGPARGLAGTMPPSNDLEDEPALLIALVHFVRGFEAPAPAPATGFPGAPTHAHPSH